MTALSFTLKSPLRQRLDASPLVPDRLLGKSPKEIATLDLQYGNRRIAAADLFDIAGDDAESVRISGSPKLDFAGRGMTRGSLIIDGDAGAYVGMHMKGGRLCVSGSAGLYAACELKGGIVEICGNAGDLLGSALPGNKKGMSEGVVIVRGDAGDRVGDHMRRGSILIEGNAGMYLGARMTAGTIAVRGRIGACAGYAMKRGTLLVYGSPVSNRRHLQRLWFTYPRFPAFAPQRLSGLEYLLLGDSGVPVPGASTGRRPLGPRQG
uniref:Formylmethanofurane dehydrogenase-like protein n=1 Tax=Methylococcus capsulatus TaxID=414 RepID=Q9ADT0_METCP|nr:formylmethanofurane dehydrogenase-like protein [Methylococcus capsulatus str. Bath]